MIKLGFQHDDSVREDEAALELPRGDATVEEIFILATVHPAANDQLIVFDGDAEILGGKSGNRERDLEALFACVLDIVRRIRVRFVISVEQSFDMFEAQKKRAVQQRSIHLKALLWRLCRPLDGRPDIEETAPRGLRFMKKCGDSLERFKEG
jgi:hypothetical protein